MYTCIRTKRTVCLLAEADRFNRLAKQASGADRPAWYRRKDKALDLAIRQAAAEFVVDSVEQNDRLLLGLTHVPSGRRVHLEPYRLSLQAQAALHRLARLAGMEYRFLRMADNRVMPDDLAHVHGLAEALCLQP